MADRVSTRIAAQTATAQFRSLVDKEQESTDTSPTVLTGKRTPSVRVRTTRTLPDVDLTTSPDQTETTEAEGEAERNSTQSSASTTLSQTFYDETVH